MFIYDQITCLGNRMPKLSGDLLLIATYSAPYLAATPAASSHTTSMLSPVLAHVEALKTLSKKKDSLRQSYQKGERAEDLEITLPSDLDTPQCSQMVRDIENALRDSEYDGHSGQGKLNSSVVA